MNIYDDLLRRLDAAGPAGWEMEYARTPIEMTRDQAREVVESERACADWLAFRFDAGPPGVPLPDNEKALEALLGGTDGTPLDAYRVLFGSGQIWEDAEAEVFLAILCNSAASALKRGTTWLATWLSARAGLAAIALGAPERAWLFLDELAVDGRRHPNLDKLAIFEPIRGNPLLERSPWVRAAICRLWPGLKVPAVPRIPFPDMGGDEVVSLSDTLAEVSRIGANQIREIIESFVHAANLAAIDEHAEDSLVRALRKRAMVPGSAAPAVDELPSWFGDWARAVARSGEVHLSRLAGLVLHQTGASNMPLAAVLVMPVARATDLSVISAGFDAPELQSFIDELAEAAAVLPAALGDALVAAALPRHVEKNSAFDTLAQHVDALDCIDATADGAIEQVIDRVRRLSQDRARDHAEVRPHFDQLIGIVRQVAGRLATGMRLDESDVEHAVATIAVPELTIGFLEIALEEEGLEPLENLLLALALCRAVSGTEHEKHWLAPLSRMASDAIFVLSEVALFGLRLRLLDNLIDAASPLMPLAELHYQRANTRRAQSPEDPRKAELALFDMRPAIRLARAEGEPNLSADATAAWIKILVWFEANGEPRRETFAEANGAIEQALQLPLEPFRQALLHQARAHLQRSQSPDEALTAFETALTLVEVTDQFWAELAAEIVETLVRAGRIDEAVNRGLAFIREVSCTTPHIELGMLHLAVGVALAKVKRTSEARQHLEAGLRQVRGRDPLNEALCRLHLARIALDIGKLESAEEHLRFLRDHRAELDRSLQLDVYRLDASAARARADADEERANLADALSVAADEATRTRLQLEMARADLAAGRAVDGLDELFARALAMSADGEFDGVLMDILRNHDASLPEATREALIGWAHRHGHPSLAARMHHLAGRDEDARSTLRAALSKPLDDHERCACVHQLITVLEPQSGGERRQLCAELEQLLDTIQDDPHMRLDLATALHMDAEDNRDSLRGARRHALHALEAVRDERTVEHGQRTLGHITVALIRASMPKSSESIADLASWLLGDLAIPASEAARLRLAVVHLLLHHGPIAHPTVIDIARRLVDRVPSGISREGDVEPLLERLRWIERCVAAKERVTPMPPTLGVLIDDLPGWLVALVLGGSAPPSAKVVAAGLAPLAVVLVARPDIADLVLALLVPLQHRLPGKARDDFLDGIWTTVQSSADRGDDAWPKLRHSLAAVHRKHRHPRLGNIASVINGSSPPRGTDRARGASSRPEQGRRSRVQPGGLQRARGCFQRGVSLMQDIRVDPLIPGAIERLGEARELLAEAVRIARKKKMPELFDYLVSHGNAWRMGLGKEIDKALRIYDSAAKLNAGSNQRAKLWKVKADALRERGSPGDLRVAEKLLERSLGLRSGWLRAETLWSAAHVALAHPDLDQAGREMRAARLLMDAVRTHRAHSEQILGLLLHRLAEWQRLRPDDQTPRRLRNELKTVYPSRTREIDEPVARATFRDLEAVSKMWAHPASQAFINVRIRLMSTAELGVDGLGLWDRLGPSVKARMVEQVERTSLVGRLDEAEDLLVTLADAPRDASRPGVLAARVLLLAHLARHGRRTAADVGSATTESLEAMPDVDDALAQSVLLQGIARVWSPDDHAEDPVRDFSLSVDLLRRCVELEGGEEKALDDTLGLLARGLRYSPAGDLEKNLREARRLYHVRLKRARESGGPDLIANALQSLANVESQMGTGSRLERLRAAEKLLQEACATARAPFMKAHLWASLAWEQTQIGMLLDGEESRRQLEQALETFGRVDGGLLDDRYRRNIDGNRTACEARIARLTGGRDAEIALWAQRLQALDELAAPYSIAMAKHNLANALMFGEDVTREQFAEGLRLCGESVQIHTVEANPRHHWESAFGVARALVGALRAGRFDLLPLPPCDAAGEARSWLRRAVEAARVLGPGEEMADAAFELCELGLCAVSTAEMTEQTEEAWAALHEAAAYLALHLESREKEAWMALRVASNLAHRLAERSLTVSVPGLTFVLQGKNAELVGRWLLRSQQPVRRPLRARLSRPRAVSAGLWEDWRTAINAGGQRRIADVLDRVREVAPEFLSEDLSNESTWRWLEARPGSTAVAFILADPVSLAYLMQVGPAGHRRTWVLGLEMPAPPRPLDALSNLMRGSVPGANAGDALDAISVWLRDHMVASVGRFLGSPPTSVLWSPGPGLRLIASGMIWRNIPVATAASIALPNLASAPGRRRSTLLVLADPGESASEPRLDLKGYGLPALQALAQSARGRGPIRLLGSVGKRLGRVLLGEGAEVRNTPASAQDILSEAGEHEIVVLLAHGEVETPESAAILCVDASGDIERLDVARLARDPERFAGATVLLLSCDGGRVGDTLAEPGGVAGTLISAGARCVVAPLWPVFIDSAGQVGQAVLKGLAAGKEPWEVLAEPQVGAHGESPMLGGPPPPLSEQRAEQSLQRLAFVTWVG